MTAPIDHVELLRALVATPSVSGDEAAAASLMITYLQEGGATVQRIDDNVVVRLKGALPGPTLLLNSHLDTVPAKDGWDHDPWQPRILDGALYGLGAGDAKASVTAMACATLDLLQSGIPCGELVFAATVLEETGGGGLDVILPQLGPIDAALVGEPTSLHGAVAQSGLLILVASVVGKTAHAARSQLGVNALTRAAQDLVAIDALTLDRIHPFLGASKANVTVIKGGDRHNVIPDRCDYTIDIRYTPSYEPAELVAILDAITHAELRVRSQRFLPVDTATSSPIVRALQQVAPQAELFGSPTMSDWVHLRGIPAVKIGPGHSERSHTANEFVELEQVAQARALYAEVARSFFNAHLEERS